MENELKDNLSLREIQAELLIMLENLTGFCEQNNITYYLAGGSLLGAIRHQGFIPWDDDVDILLPRKDYDRLVECLSASVDDFLKDNGYSFKELRTDKTYSLPYAKMENNRIMVRELLSEKASGLWIDIFPLDGIAKKKKLQMFIAKLLKYCRWESACLEHRYTSKWKKWGKIVLFWPLILIGTRRWALMLDKYARRYSLDTSRMAACVVGKYMEKECVDKCVFDTQKEISFEGKLMKIPQGYHEYLTSIYGEYMKLPKEEKRHKHM